MSVPKVKNVVELQESQSYCRCARDVAVWHIRLPAPAELVNLKRLCRSYSVTRRKSPVRHCFMNESDVRDLWAVPVEVWKISVICGWVYKPSTFHIHPSYNSSHHLSLTRSNSDIESMFYNYWLEEECLPDL